MESRNQCKKAVLDTINVAKEMLGQKDKGDELNDLIVKINQQYETFQTEHLDYIASLGDDVGNEQDHLDEVKANVEHIRVEIHKYNNPAPKTRSRQTTSSRRAALAAEKAKIEAQAALLEEKQQLEREEQNLKQRREALAVKMKLAKVNAQEKILAEEEDEQAISTDAEEEDDNEVTFNKKHQHTFQNKQEGAAPPNQSSPSKQEAIAREKSPPDTPRNDKTAQHDLSSRVPRQGETEQNLSSSTQAHQEDNRQHQTSPGGYKDMEGSTYQASPGFTDTERNQEYTPSPAKHDIPKYREGSSTPSDHSTNLNDLIGQQREIINILSAPPVEIPLFDGSPLMYYPFMRAFEENVEKVVTDSSSRLTRLVKYCTGKAGTLVKGCLIMHPQQGYKRAKTLLCERFGNPFTISQAWVDKVTSEPTIKPNDGPAIQQLADDLSICHITLEAVGALAEINNQTNLQKIIRRLPVSLQTRWRKEVMYLKREKGHLPRLMDVAEFVTAAAEEVNDPIFGIISSSTPVKPQGNQTGTRKASSFNTSANQVAEKPNDRPCPVCSSTAHKVFYCEEFKKMTITDRANITKEKGLCFNCLGPNHTARKCKCAKGCKICGRKHNTLLHMPQGDSTSTAEPQNKVTSGYINNTCLRRVALPVTSVVIKPAGGGKAVTTYALLDPGSSASFCSNKLLEMLGISGRETEMSLTTVDRANSIQKAKVVSLEVSDIYNQSCVHMPVVLSRSVLPINAENIPSYEDISSYAHLRGIDIPSADVSEVLLLIGQDTPEALVPHDVIRGARGEPYATRSLLGWTLNGPMKTQGTTQVSCGFIAASESLNQQVEEFWKLDMHGLVDEGPPISINDKKVMDLWQAETKHHNGHYVMPIPFKDQGPKLPASSKVAEVRLEYLKKKLLKDQHIRDQYVNGMTDLIKKGYAVEVNNAGRDDGKVFYLPHHAVVNPNKDKLRIVFDCAAKVQGRSLNSFVHQGPDITNKLIGVLLRFRQKPVAIMADVEAMFHQVIVNPDDQDVLRFLWWKEGDMTRPPSIFKLTRHLFGGCWSPSCCTTALQRVVQDFGDGYSELAKQSVLQSFYVDDLLTSVKDSEIALTLIQELKELLQKGGFNLTKWVSNSTEAIKSMPHEHRSKQYLDLGASTSFIARALGVIWDVTDDQLTYRVKVPDKPTTKRGILSMLSSIYDPLGIVSPFTLRAKLVFQELCRLKLGWDDTIPDTCKTEWERWTAEVSELDRYVKLPRCMTNGDEDARHQLHHFADGSTRGYGVVSYLLTQVDDSISCSIIMAKARLAPIKTVTIPRLELMAATLAAKQDQLLRQELNIDLEESQFWSDSTIVLQYIHNEEKRLHTFVANRVSSIRSASTTSQWHYVRSEDNMADYASRGIQVEQLSDSLWLSGPQFLKENIDLNQWPKFQAASPSDDDPEVKSEPNPMVFAAAADCLSPTMKLIHHYSDWNKLRKAVAWMIMIKDVLCKKSKPTSVIGYEYFKQAEITILSLVQQECFKQEIEDLQIKGHVRIQSRLSDLKPVIRNGILQVGGRLAKSPVEESIKHPIILPSDHHVTTLIIHDIHQRTGHSGREHVLATCREAYWVVGGRRAIRRRLGLCITCKKRDAPVQQQQMADLPEDRVTPGAPPFSSIGIDMFGPILVKQGRARAKRYGCLFTCLTTRAVHVEIAHSLDADSFVQCLHRMTSRRGAVSFIRSDQGRNFIGAEKTIKDEINKWNARYIQDHFNKENIRWNFNPPHASHHGGVWERQIRTVRKVMAGLTQEQVLNDEALSTLLCLTESIVNNRPIASVSTDPRDLNPLTPNHLLILRSAEVPPGLFNESDCYSRKRWRQVNYLANLFWKRWVREYLPELQRRSKWLMEKRGLKKNDLVLIVDIALPRNQWKMGRVQENVVDNTRSVKIQTSSGTISRPFNKVCLLEADIAYEPQKTTGSPAVRSEE